MYTWKFLELFFFFDKSQFIDLHLYATSQLPDTAGEDRFWFGLCIDTLHLHLKLTLGLQWAPETGPRLRNSSSTKLPLKLHISAYMYHFVWIKQMRYHILISGVWAILCNVTCVILNFKQSQASTTMLSYANHVLTPAPHAGDIDLLISSICRIAVIIMQKM